MLKRMLFNSNPESTKLYIRETNDRLTFNRLATGNPALFFLFKAIMIFKMKGLFYVCEDKIDRKVYADQNLCRAVDHIQIGSSPIN